MKCGINIANHRDLMSKRYIVETARMAEDLGFDSVWIPDPSSCRRRCKSAMGRYTTMR